MRGAITERAGSVIQTCVQNMCPEHVVGLTAARRLTGSRIRSGVPLYCQVGRGSFGRVHFVPDVFSFSQIRPIEITDEMKETR